MAKRFTILLLLVSLGILIPSCLVCADVEITLSGMPDSPLVEITGTGSFIEATPDDDIGAGFGWSGDNGGDFAGGQLENGPGLGSMSRIFAIAGDLQVTDSTGFVNFAG